MSIPVGTTCNFSVQVRGTQPGPQVNNTGQVTSTNGGTGNSTSATLPVNGPPVITPPNLSRAAGSTTLTTTIANAADAEDPEDQLVVQISTDGTNFFDSVTTGNVTVTLVDQNGAATGINPTAAGAVIATITTPCNATVGSINLFLRVTGTDGQRDTKPWALTITPNPPPVLGYNPTTVTAGTTLVINPATGPADNGTINPLVLQPVSPATGLVLSLNTATGQIMVASATLIGSYGVTVSATDNCGATTNVTFMINVVCPTITLSPVTLPNAMINTAYSQMVSAAPTGTTYSFSVTSGALPAGLALNSNGSFSGAPTQSGTFNFRVTATGFRDYTLTVNCPAITVNPASLPGGAVGTLYSQSVNATPAGSYSFAVSSGALPTGLTLNASAGAITGIPTQDGTFTFTIAAAAGGCSGSRSYTVTIACPIITFSPSSPLPNGQAGVSYSQTIGVTPAGSYNFSLTGGNLPAELTLNPVTGVISGTVTATGTFTFTVKAQAATGCNAAQSYSLTIGCPAVTVNPATLPAGTTVTPYSQTVTASPAGGNYTYTVSSGALPSGLTLNPSTGALSGTPFANGSFTFTVMATGFGGCTGSRQYTITVGGSNGDGKSDLAVFRGGDGNWLVANSSNGQLQSTPWGSSAAPYNDVATPGDYDGDRKTDFAVFRRGGDQSGYWYIKRSSDGQTVSKLWGRRGGCARAGRLRWRWQDGYRRLARCGHELVHRAE